MNHRFRERCERRQRRHRSPASQMVLGAIVIGLGLLFLLDNLNLFDFRIVLDFWPAVFIVFGALKLYDARSTGGYLVGGGLVAAGVLMTLQRMGIIYWSWNLTWPLLMMAVGLSVVLRAFEDRHGRVEEPTAPLNTENVVNATAVLGGFERRVVSQDFRGGEISAVMGGCMLDLREANLTQDAVINVFVLFGGITLRVPPDWTVVLHGTPIMGGFDEKTANPPQSSKRLIVKGYAIMGGVEIRN